MTKLDALKLAKQLSAALGSMAQGDLADADEHVRAVLDELWPTLSEADRNVLARFNAAVRVERLEKLCIGKHVDTVVKNAAGQVRYRSCRVCGRLEWGDAERVQAKKRSAECARCHRDIMTTAPAEVAMVYCGQCPADSGAPVTGGDVVVQARKLLAEWAQPAGVDFDKIWHAFLGLDLDDERYRQLVRCIGTTERLLKEARETQPRRIARRPAPVSIDPGELLRAYQHELTGRAWNSAADRVEAMARALASVTGVQPAPPDSSPAPVASERAALIAEKAPGYEECTHSQADAHGAGRAGLRRLDGWLDYLFASNWPEHDGGDTIWLRRAKAAPVDDDLLPPDDGPDCTATEHAPHCRHFKDRTRA